MSVTRLSRSASVLTATRYLIVLMLVACVAALAGCGSTKVYNNQKTVVYKGDLFNVSNVQKISTTVEGLTPEGDVINMKGMDKGAAGDLLEEHDSLIVSTVFNMDEQELVYQRSRITKSSEFSSMMKNFDRAQSSINKFMANKKSTQLKLR